MKVIGYEILEKVDKSKGMNIIWTDSEIILECPYYCWTIPLGAVIFCNFLSADDWRRRDFEDCPEAPPINSELIDGFGMMELCFYISKTDLLYRFNAPQGALDPKNCPDDADALFGYKCDDIDALKTLCEAVNSAMKNEAEDN